jgi:hypothetical protein
MARYRLSRGHFLAGRHYLAGQVVDWNGPPSKHMRPIDDKAREAVTALETKTRGQGRSRDARSTQEATAVRLAGLRGALHSAATAPGDRPLWCGFTPVVPDEQGRPAPPPSYPEKE